MTNNFTKDEITLYFSEKAIQHCNSSIVTATRKHVLSNNDFYNPKTPVSTHEEAGTLMMVHALDLAEDGKDIDFFSQDTDWIVLILNRMEKQGSNTHFATGSTENRRFTPLLEEIQQVESRE